MKCATCGSEVFRAYPSTFAPPNHTFKIWRVSCENGHDQPTQTADIEIEIRPTQPQDGKVFFDTEKDKLMMWTEIEPPRYYKHFKGIHHGDPLFGIYKLLSDNAMMHDGEPGEERERMVVYSHITDPKRTYIRPYANFFEEVIERSPQPHYVSRFRLLGPEELIELGLM